MQTDQAKLLTDNALDQLAKALEQGRSPQLTAYLAAMGRFHRYSFGNVLLIACQRPEATRVAGFVAWKKLKRFVRKGEKGILIVAPVVRRLKQKESDDEQRRVAGFTTAHVFDVSQTDGEPLPEFARISGDPAAHSDQLKAAIAAQGIALEYSTEIGEAFGLSTGGKIILRAGLAPAEEFATLVHEFAHELLHRGDRRTSTTKTVRETEAEAVAFVVCHAIGLNTSTAASDYIQLYQGDKTTLAESLDFIQKTAATIIEAIESP